MRAFDEGNLRAEAEEFLSADNTDWHRLGFKSPAFEDNQNANYFTIDAWEDAFADLEDFCEGTDPLLVIPSIPGSGKTTFLQQFISQRDDRMSLHYLRARSIFSLRHLLNAISENFTQFRNVSTNTDKFINELRATAQEAGPQLLIVDDAQRLSRETLAGLLQIVASQDLSDLWLRVVLCGEPQLEDRVQSLFDELEFAFSFNAIILDSLDINDTRAYLKHRLDEAGFTGKFPFSKSMVKHIHTLSSGFPGRINRVAQQVLIDMAKNQQWETKRSSISFADVFAKHKIKFISLSLLLFAGYLLWYSQQTQPMLTAHRQLTTIPTPTRHKPEIRFPYLQKRTQTQQQTRELPQNNGEFVSTQTRNDSSANISLSEQKTLNNKPLNHPKEKVKPIAITVTQTKQPVAATSTAQQKPTTKKLAPVVTPVTRKPANSSYHDTATTQNGFTIQLIGLHDKERLKQYIRQQHLQDHAAYYETKLKGQEWYVLTYGQYKTAQEAHEAIKTLPHGIQAHKPWVKSLSTIHSPLIR